MKDHDRRCNETHQEAKGRASSERFSKAFEEQYNHLWLPEVSHNELLLSGWWHCFHLVSFVLLLLWASRTPDAMAGPRHMGCLRRTGRVGYSGSVPFTEHYYYMPDTVLMCLIQYLRQRRGVAKSEDSGIRMSGFRCCPYHLLGF